MSRKQTRLGEQPNQDEQIYLLKYLVALELYHHGLRQTEIAKRLCLQTAILNKMLKGLSKKVKDNEE